MRFIVKDYKCVPVGASSGFGFHNADTPDQIYNFFKEVIELENGYEPEKEHVVVVTLNTRFKITGWHLVSIGGLSEATCHPREVFRPVIVRGAYSFVLIHNHPSGDPSPSRADIAVTSRLREASQLLQVGFADHVIVGSSSPGKSGYFSFREGGFL